MVSQDFVLYYKSNGLPHNRLGICAGKKAVGNAVARNRAKRLLREVYRLNRPYYQAGYDLVLVARAGLLKLNHKQLNQEIKDSFIRARLIDLTSNG